MNNRGPQVNPSKFVALVFPFFAALFVMPRIMQYEPGDGLANALHKGNIALYEMMAVTAASFGLMILLDIRQRLRRN